MKYSALLLLAVAATSATANMRPRAIPLPRRVVEARQTDDDTMPTSTSTPDGDDGTGDDGSDGSGDDSGLGDDGTGDEPAACDDAAASLVTDMPTAPEDLDTFASTYTGTDDCITVPASLTADWDDYVASVDAWYSSSSDDVSSFLATCTDYSLDLLSDVCTVDGEEDGSSSSATATGAAGGGGGAAETAGTTAKTTDEGSGASAKTTDAAKTSGSSASEGTKTSSSASGTVTSTAGAAPVRDVGVVGAVLAGALGVAIAL